jgi:hypothetical protein
MIFSSLCGFVGHPILSTAQLQQILTTASLELEWEWVSEGLKLPQVHLKTRELGMVGPYDCTSSKDRSARTISWLPLSSGPCMLPDAL